ncbi:MAG: penicillin acylase family protein [Methylococcales bacterium]
MTISLSTGFAVIALMLSGGFYFLRASLPVLDGTIALAGISAPVRVEFDGQGIPRIQASTRADAFHALGFVTARDRLFQMDLLRRSTAGRLAEIFGPESVNGDRWHRIMGFSHLASEIFARLPAEQREVLEAYSAGVNVAMGEFKVLPFEFWVLGYTPEPWRPEDSLLVVLNMAVAMNWNIETERRERAATVMKAVLPLRVSTFLTPRSDGFIDRMIGSVSRLPLPIEDLAKLIRRSEKLSGLLSDPPPPRGSNAWVVGPAKSRSGHAVLANDMHLDLGVPNLWYRAELHYGQAQLYGLTLPGVPVLIVGSNGHLAWGFTGSGVDVADLVLIDLDSERPGAYRTPDGSQAFATRLETISVRGQAEIPISVRTTLWGPVLEESLMGKPVVVRWTALDPGAVNLNHLNLDRVSSVEEAIPLFNGAGAPTLNVLFADREDNIGWTLTGRIPRRFGSDGLTPCASSDARCGWNGYLAGKEVPKIINPPSGVLVNANQPMNLADRALGYDSAPGYRAYRIGERLAEFGRVDEGEMLALQLDTQAGFYRFYRNLAVDTLNAATLQDSAERETLLRYLQSWDGRAETTSLGLPLIVEFRRLLLDRVLSPLVSSCRQLDPTFKYHWHLADSALQQLLSLRSPELLPDPDRYATWDAFLIHVLQESKERVIHEHGVKAVEKLNWGHGGGERIAHPLSGTLPFLTFWLDMPGVTLPGCAECVRVARRGGATQRLVVSPGRENRAILHMPGGQSGHPLSPHYRDQYSAWVEGRATALRVAQVRYRLELVPFVPHTKREISQMKIEALELDGNEQ